jgi:hypothetical protein
MAGIARMLLGPHHELPGLLRLAETDDATFVRAGQLVEGLPSLTRRKLLGTLAAVTWPAPPRRPYRDDLDVIEPVGKFSDLPEGVA